MKNYIKKHPAAVAILAVAVVALFGLAYTQRQRVLSNPTEKSIADGPRASAPCENDFYYNQLNEKEQEAYHTMLQHLKDKEGGVTELPSPLTGKEYMRVLSALENSSGQYFYGLFEIPMTDEDFYVRYEERDLTRIIDPIIAKVILFQSFSNGLDVPGEYDDRGRVSNLSEINTLLSQNDPEKLKKIEEKEAEIEACLTEILSGLPEEAGEKEAVDYFLSWMDKNLELNTEIGVNAFQFNSMTEVLDQAYIYNNLSCVLEKRHPSPDLTNFWQSFAVEAAFPPMWYRAYGAVRKQKPMNYVPLLWERPPIMWMLPKPKEKISETSVISLDRKRRTI